MGYTDDYERIDEAYYRERQIHGWSRDKKPALIEGLDEDLPGLAKSYWRNNGSYFKTDPDFQITDSRKIVDTRNRLIHGYDGVSSDVIWLIVSRYLPILEIEVKELLKK